MVYYGKYDIIGQNWVFHNMRYHNKLQDSEHHLSTVPTHKNDVLRRNLGAFVPILGGIWRVSEDMYI